MEPRSLKYVAAACAGQLVGGESGTRVSRACTDSRQLRRGDLFFALSGDRFDGHTFLPEVSDKGAAAAVIDRDRAPVGWTGCPLILTACARVALGDLATRYRDELDLVMVAVGGSNGKTTTKDLLGALLSVRYRTLVSEASFNNDIGVPLTLTRLEPAHQVAVVEVGTNHPGELAPLLRMVRPKFGVLTSIGREHLEYFGNLDGVIAEQGSLAEALPESGKLFTNGDFAGLDRLVARCPASVVTAGFGELNPWRALTVDLEPDGVRFSVSCPIVALEGEYRLPLLGRHQVANALLAIALAAEMGLTPGEIRAGLQTVRPPKMRMEARELNGVGFLNDAYNANADSVGAALETLRDLPCAGRRIAVLGDMAELGAHAEGAHGEAGERAANCGIDVVVAVGRLAAVTAAAARKFGVNEVLEYADNLGAAEALSGLICRGDRVLLKASRASRLEDIFRLLEAGGLAIATRTAKQ